MGFLKFLKREKKENLDELDLPPAPPPLGGFEENLPELPDFPDFDKEISAPEESSKFELPENEGQMTDFGNEEFADFPSYPIEEKPMTPIPTITSPPIPEPMQPMPKPAPVSQPMQEPEQPAPEEPRFMPLDSYPKMEGRLFSQEKRMLHERPAGKTIYVRVDRFKATLGSINMVRTDLRKSEEALTKLENLKISKDKSFDKARASLDDLQKKLIFVDKTLFKGD